MEYRYLGRTGIRVSPLCLGCMMFGGKTGPEDSYDIIDAAIEQGVNFLDVANVYATGKSEVVTGEALQRNGHRDYIVLATKCHGNMHKPAGKVPEGFEVSDLHAKLNPNQWGNSRRQIVEQCDASLKRLRTDWIDLYQIHRPHPDCPIDETLRAMDDLVRAGKVRYIGCSTFAAWQVVESLWVAEKLGLNRFVTEQPPYHPLDRRIERELVPVAETYGLGLIPWSPLASGFLTGKYERGKASEGTRLNPEEKDGRSGQMMQSDQAWAMVDLMRELADAKSATPTQVALAWNMHQPGITAPIIGPRTMEQLKDNLKAVDVEITDDDRAKVDAIVPPGEHAVPYYEARFGPHVYR